MDIENKFINNIRKYLTNRGLNGKLELEDYLDKGDITKSLIGIELRSTNEEYIQV
ncbi:hypothetical protein [Wolbachia endosymbiont of Brugia pahangi]|uniref:hypothetical protein n=1 Tax=Wolbachia endosymbiont of Brugia pahangi TaxID=96495 RepID=UPI001435A03F|nr:hypothetical protein [Wolbachia endosymbiont of Brugia pahangi]QIT36389.1 hypothetical protein WBP_0989 [Wolbachia endosymbiont of Brugia pahangi]